MVSYKGSQSRYGDDVLSNLTFLVALLVFEVDDPSLVLTVQDDLRCSAHGAWKLGEPSIGSGNSLVLADDHVSRRLPA